MPITAICWKLAGRDTHYGGHSRKSHSQRSPDQSNTTRQQQSMTAPRVLPTYLKRPPPIEEPPLGRKRDVTRPGERRLRNLSHRITLLTLH
ncbi:hypothetical protein AOLI_G00306840 [Acnodon oligacanthus]